MTDSLEAYSLPPKIEPKLASIHDVWRALRRGGNEVPFSDDFQLSLLGEAAADAILIDVFETPMRFRFGLAGRSVAARLGEEANGRFVDELESRGPVDHLEAQCAATIRSRAPTYFQHRSSGAKAYARIVLPFWGNGRIDMLLVAAATAGG